MAVISQKTLQQLALEEVSLFDDSGNLVLNKCNFSFPVTGNCRLICSQKKHSGQVLALIANNNQPESGKLIFNGHEVNEDSFEEFLPWRLQIGFGFESSALLSNRSLKQNLLLPILFHDRMDIKFANEWVDELLGRFDIIQYADKRPADVSPFVRKACLLIRAFAGRTSIVLLDDPNVFLHRNQYPVLLTLIKELQNEGVIKSLYFTASSEELADCLVDSVVRIHGGKLRLVYDGLNEQKKVACL